jgi:ligand-binding sensor domain-containing protein
MKQWKVYVAVMLLLSIAQSARAAEAPEAKEAGPALPFVYENWDVFTTKSTHGGLPNDHIFYVKVAGDQVWIGTENGLACYEDGKFKNWGEKDGMPWPVVAGIDVSLLTGDVWLALFGGGLCRFSGGRFDHFHQLNSGLVNDVVYGVAVQDHMIWAATTAGVSSYDTVTGEWTIYTEKNAPMEEIWCYNVCYAAGKVYVAVWGGGILEWDVELKRWKAFVDPDGEMEIDLYRDDGLIHIITTAASYDSGILWASTYFGLSRYDGRHWRGYMQHDSGLASDFINFNRGRGQECWACTDKGLSALVDFPTDTWVTYNRNEENCDGVAIIQRGKEVIKKVPTEGSIPHRFVLCVDFQGDDVWVGTSKGLARGIGKGRWVGLKPSKPPALTESVVSGDAKK